MLRTTPKRRKATRTFRLEQPIRLHPMILFYPLFLSALGRYKESAARYQAAKPLNEFHDVCGLALSLFMAGQLKDSFQGKSIFLP